MTAKTTKATRKKMPNKQASTAALKAWATRRKTARAAGRKSKA